MSEGLTFKVSGGCPKCGNPGISVPKDYTEQSIIICPKCKHSASHKEFFQSES